MVIAERCDVVVDIVFDYTAAMTARTVLLGAGILCTSLLLSAYLSGGALREVISSDAAEYTSMAHHLLSQGMYSLDGLHPTFEREPMMSVWLAIIFAFTGQQVLSVFVAQALLFAVCTLIFLRELEHWMPGHSNILWLVLCALPTAAKSILSFNRELLAYALFIIVCTCVLRAVRRNQLSWALVGGFIMGILSLVYFSFIILPACVALWFVYQRKYIAVLALVLACVAPAGWLLRNVHQGFGWQIIGQQRAAAAQYFRGVAARDIHGIAGPWQCLWVEYVSRDYASVPVSCFFNGVVHQNWPAGFAAVDPVVSKVGKKLILDHPLAYAWYSVAEVAEFHFPYVGGGWSRAHNILLTVTWFLLLLGLAGLPLSWRKKANRSLIVLAACILVPTVGFYALVDATPRYHVPFLALYTLLSIVGYDGVILWLRTALASRP